MDKIIECVPNISEGRNSKTIVRLSDVIKQCKGVKLLNVDAGFSANRTIFTFIANPENIINAAFNLYIAASELIDMRTHYGNHPRIGAVDLCPFVPLKQCSMQEVVDLSYLLAEKVSNELKIPVYCYEFSAKKEKRRHLENIRRGGYEKLAEKLKNPEWKPDFGSQIMNETFGATVIGARNNRTSTFNN